MPSLSTIVAKDLMSQPVITAKYDTPLSAVIKLLKDNAIRHLPIVNDNGQLMGIISNRDMLVATSPPANIDGQRWASHIMTPNPITATALLPASTLASLLIQHKIGCLPILAAQNIVGIVTESDFVQFFAGIAKNKNPSPVRIASKC